MIELKNYIQESLLDDIDTTINNGLDVLKTQVEKFIEENYYGKFKISDKPNKDGLFEVDGLKHISVKKVNNITSLTNGLFVWNKVDSYFSCTLCKSLESLKGSPKEVNGGFYCSNCKSLKSLEGAPEKVNGNFICYGCNSLVTLKGAPKVVSGNFDCYDCISLKTLEGAPEKVYGNFNCYECDSLKSLEGAPEKVYGDFNCMWCKSLESLKGAPKEVDGDFYCNKCKTKFTKNDVKKLSTVKGRIYC